MNHIRDKLPDMKARLNTLMGQAQQELNSFGDAAVYGDKNQVRTTLKCPIIVFLTAIAARTINFASHDTICS